METARHFRRISRAVRHALLVAGLGVMAIPLGAQSGTPTTSQTPRPNARIMQRQLGAFDVFLDSHTDIANDLKGNPALVNDPSYLAQHPELQDFLTKHPGIQQDLQQNPARVLKRERRLEESGRDINRRELRNFDHFLDSHSDIAKDLRKDPTLVNNSDYLSSHPELKGFLDKHHGVSSELKEHPRYFAHRERRYERPERGAHHRKQG